MSDNYELNRKKARQTCIDKYGVDNPQKVREIQEKTKRTNIERYGAENVFAAEQIKEKIKSTNRARYGVEHNLQCEIFIEKAKNTKLIRYGRANIGQFGTTEHDEAMLAKYGSRRFPGNQRYRFNDVLFDSFPELAVYVYAVDHNIKIIREPVCIDYIFENKKRHYFPDFEYDGKLIEIKGEQFFREDGIMHNPYNSSLDALYAAKQKCMSDNNVIVWRRNEYQFAIDYFNSKYSKLTYKL